MSLAVCTQLFPKKMHKQTCSHQHVFYMFLGIRIKALMALRISKVSLETSKDLAALTVRMPILVALGYTPKMDCSFALEKNELSGSFQSVHAWLDDHLSLGHKHETNRRQVSVHGLHHPTRLNGFGLVGEAKGTGKLGFVGGKAKL